MTRAGRALVAVIGVAFCGALAWTPASPFALDRANAAYLAGDLVTATSLYEQVAVGWTPASTRSLAAERASLLHLQSGDGKGAVRWLRTAIPLAVGPERTRLQRRLAYVYTSRFDDARRAAEVYREAAVDADRDQRPDDALALRVEAARAYARGEAWADAAEAWTAALPGLVGPARDEAEAALLRAAQHRVDDSDITAGQDAPAASVE